jgi:Protein of unknown function (DUF1553)/Protein of unknown function (DUF1549)/Concanavalin A-like lectin/glucanases superfamily/Planctomycete cytochrome C
MSLPRFQMRVPPYFPGGQASQPHYRSAYVITHVVNKLGKSFASVLLVLLGQQLQAASLPDKVDFHFHVKPILSDRCFACHGPDEKARKGKLRLDTREGAFKALEDGMFVIKSGDAKHSELIRRITATDPDDIMPPPKSKMSLTSDEIALLKKWVEQGADYPAKSHWAFNPVTKVAVPKVDGANRVENPIDAFVLQKLARENLKSSSRATKEILIRRLALDLTGLPPKLEEVDAFLADNSPEAYRKVVQQYLSSPRYGERMALDWLDLARFADTFGYQSDVDMNMYPWRDWVIKSFNQNLPYDLFILFQVAGDLLPNATREQILATAFNRLHRQTNEGGSVEEEFRNEYVSDRVHTLGTAFLGLTMECCRCHDHKYDPITQKDYYRLGSFFNSIDESGLYSHFTRAVPTPTLLLYADGVEQKHLALKNQVLEKENALDSVRQSSRPRFEAWLKTNEAPVFKPSPAALFAFDAVNGGKSPNLIETNKPASLHENPQLVDGKSGKALLFTGDNDVTCKGAGEFTRTDPFSFSLWLKLGEIQERAVIFHRSRSWTDSGSRGYELLLEQGKPSFGLIHFYPGNAVQIRAQRALPTNEWSHLVITYDGSSRAAGLKLYVNGSPAEVQVVHDNLYKDIIHRSEWGDSDVGGVHLTLAGRFRDSGFKNGAIDEFQVFNQCLTPLEARAVGGFATESPKQEELFSFYLNYQDQEYQTALAELKKVRQEESKVVNDVKEIMAMKESKEPRPTHLLKRGRYDMPGEIVDRGTPEGIFPMPSEYPNNRLGLAKWLVDRRNPLTARVVVNRIWRMHFGRGIVATQEDFGNQGQLPTHPELLDFLAGWFMDHKWDVKALHELIVTSATYCQTSVTSADTLAKDPENHLLARGPKHRMQAELVRDCALAVSGLLSDKIGGPSVKPYQPAGLWEESGTGKTYTQDHGDKLYRRSLYTFWRRTAPPASMLTFDAGSREVCTAKRETTATPLQSLILLNDPQFLEASRVLAETLVRDSKTELEPRIQKAFRLATGRAPQAKEKDILAKLYQEQLAWFTDHPDAADKYLAIGETKPDKSLPVAEVAATAVLADALFNHDEFVMER